MKQVNSRANELTQRALVAIAGFGALSCEAVAAVLGSEVDRVSACIVDAQRAGWLVEGRENLYVVTEPGINAARLRAAMWRGTCKVTDGNVGHLRAIAFAAAQISGRYGCKLVGERATRRREFTLERPLCSAEMSGEGYRAQLPRLHRADFTATLGDGRLVAVEVECTRKSRRKLVAIVEAWVRTSKVSYVVYAIPKDAREVRRDMERVLRECAAEDQSKIVLVWLEDLEHGVARLEEIFR